MDEGKRLKRPLPESAAGVPAGVQRSGPVGGGRATEGETVHRKADRSDPKSARTTTKAIVWLCLLNGIAWVWCFYLLAWCGRAEIAESLSKVAITEIIGVVLVYSLKSLFENLSKNNQWPDKKEAPASTDRDL